MRIFAIRNFARNFVRISQNIAKFHSLDHVRDVEWFFRQKTPYKPLMLDLKPSQTWLCIREDIRQSSLDSNDTALPRTAIIITVVLARKLILTGLFQLRH
jgi:hypothetical protein